MGSEIPKQFLPLNGKPLLMLTMEAFHRFSAELRLILVLPSAQTARWRELCREHRFGIPHHLVEGGETRGQSVRNGLDAITASDGLVAVHDGVRPLVSHETIARGFALAGEGKCAVPAVPVNDSLRMLIAGGSHPLDREMVRRIQTPQVFPLNTLRKAYSLPDFSGYTDDAQLVERAGYAITLFDGNPENIKITTPADLKIAAVLAQEPGI